MPLDITRIQAICFDVDGTLSDTDDAWIQRVSSIIHIITPWIKKEQIQKFSRTFIMAVESPANAVYRLYDWTHLDNVLAKISDRIAHNRTLYQKKNFWIMPGVKELIESLRDRFPLAVVSARDEVSTRHFLEQFQLLDYFQIVVTAQTCSHTKPYPDPVIHAAQYMNVLPENCLMVGDTTVDILSGKRAGMQTVGVLCGFGKEKELRNAGADYILPTTAELAQLIQ
jgi:HAD superfamily hydrolase (TIGR01549 family)